MEVRTIKVFFATPRSFNVEIYGDVYQRISAMRRGVPIPKKDGAGDIFEKTCIVCMSPFITKIKKQETCGSLCRKEKMRVMANIRNNPL
jgi:hypothetical protein